MAGTPAVVATARAFYQLLALLSRRAEQEARQVWRELDPADLRGSWVKIGAADRLMAGVGTLQQAAVVQAESYVDRILRAQGVDPAPLGDLVYDALTGIASDGRDLDDLFYTPIISTLADIAQGKDVDEAIRSGEESLATIVNTQISDTGRTATEIEMAVEPEVTGYVRMLVPPSCGRCAILAGRRYRYSTGFERHPRCFPAGAVVSGPPVEAATRRWFEGELVVVRTAGGKKLTITGNHPVLTGRGWVPAHFVNESDDVVCSALPQGARSVLVPDQYQVPARIEDLWRSDSMTGVARMPVAPQDFHGDGFNAEVDVVAPDRDLRRWVESALPQKIGKETFAGGPELAIALAGLGPTDQSLFRVNPPRGRSGGLGLPSSFRSGSLCCSHQASLATASDRHASQLQPPPYDRSADIEAQTERVLTRSRKVGLDDGAVIDRKIATRWDAPAVPFSMQNRMAYAARGTQLRFRLAGQVAFDRVVETTRIRWSGHVYNLTSQEGWYCADGVIVSNCDCVHIPAVEDVSSGDLTTDPQEYFNSLTEADQNKYFGKATAEAIRLGADMNQAVNSRRGARGLSRPGRLTNDEQQMLRGGRARGKLERVDVYGRKLAVTDEGTTRRGIAGKRLIAQHGSVRGTESRYRRAKVPRLMPDAILEVANGDRDTAVRMFKKFGYII